MRAGHGDMEFLPLAVDPRSRVSAIEMEKGFVWTKPFPIIEKISPCSDCCGDHFIKDLQRNIHVLFCEN